VAIRENQHEVDMNLEIAYALGLDRKLVDRVPHLNLDEGLRRFGKKRIESLKNGEVFKRVVCMHVGSSSSQWWKRWSVEKYAKVCEHLIRDHDLVILLGSREERELSLAMARQMSVMPHILAGETSFLEDGAIVAESDLLICNDSGLMHLAAAVGTPVVAIFGPTDYTKFAPLGDRHRIVRKDFECSPCYKMDGDWMVRNCPYEYRCLNSIGVEDVLRHL
ncbi:MAG TPA: glycosyltransferase family 9 protein, partial [Candidatus Acidoferrales bacterium]|nr:glycosyltransferase family 9 protein [Candidatus Acidoferrales bacterium]